MRDFRLSANHKALKRMLGVTLVVGLMLHIHGRFYVLNRTKSEKFLHELEVRGAQGQGMSLAQKSEHVEVIKNANKVANIMAQKSRKESGLKLGGESFWHLEGVRQKLKERVQAAVKNLKTVQREARNWTSQSLPPIFTRASMIYLPPDNAGQVKQFGREFRAFFTSWIIMRTKQPKNFRTDLLVVSTEDKLTQLMAMGCQPEMRTTANDEDRCIILNHIPMKVVII